jgi:hypothetical protein
LKCARRRIAVGERKEDVSFNRAGLAAPLFALEVPMFAILLVISQVDSVQDLTLEQINTRLSDTVYAARGGWLFHSLGRMICQSAARQNYLVSVTLRYGQLEREYVALGGTFVPDDQQEIMLTPYYTQCEPGSASEIASRWRAASDDTERDLRTMQALLERKRQLMR